MRFVRNDKKWKDFLELLRFVRINEIWFASTEEMRVELQEITLELQKTKKQAGAELGQAHCLA